MNKDDWKPIGELEDIYQQPLFVASPLLVDLDCNLTGISEGFWQDTSENMVEEGENGDEPQHLADGGYWVVRGWDMCNDEFTTVKLNKADVTHFLIPVGPYDIVENITSKEYGAVYLEGVRLDAAD